MRYLNCVFVITFLFFSVGCVSQEVKKESNESTETTSSNEVDKVETLPVDYNKSIKPDEKREISSYEDLMKLWKQLDYTPEAWASGIRKIPRTYVINIGPNWGDKTSKEITVLNKKRVFFRAMAPLVLHSNELILLDRSKLLKINSVYKENGTTGEKNGEWIFKLASIYKVEIEGKEIDLKVLTELESRVDVIPNSLALAQAAVESGWGTSRFAEEGNSIFGQWSWGEDAIKPDEQRDGLGNYGIAAFESLQQSVSAYMLNINSHNAYSDLRNIRLELRLQNKKPSGEELADGLLNYSERGETYVTEIKSMIRYNKLSYTDDAYFSGSSVVYLFPRKN